MAEFTLGLDFGTLSLRTILLNLESGEIEAESVKSYPHAVMDRYLPDGKTPLPSNWALQFPQDYLTTMEDTICEIKAMSNVNVNNIVGMAIDFTSCTVLPTTLKGTPLCDLDQFKDHPHAYAKLWKHHGAQKEAHQIETSLKNLANEKKIKNPDSVSSEMLLPKLLEIFHDDKIVFNATDVFIEAADWLTWILTGNRKRSINMAIYKAMWTPAEGYLKAEFLHQIEPGFEDALNKFAGEISSLDSGIGCLLPEWADRLGLNRNLVVGTSVIDSHAGLIGSGVCNAGEASMVLGTSSVVLQLSEFPYSDHGVVGSVKGGVFPEYYLLEDGLPAVGDMFSWFINNLFPFDYHHYSLEKNISPYDFLVHKAFEKKPGESGLIALDWWNGDKTPYVNSDLSGLIIGFTLHTKAEDVYRALIESCAFGTRQILDEYRNAGTAVNEIVVSGGIAEKSPQLLQLFADVLKINIKRSSIKQTAAFGSAILASVCAKKGKTEKNIRSEVNKYATKYDCIYKPDHQNSAIYDELYGIYRDLVCMFNPIEFEGMQKLRSFR